MKLDLKIENASTEQIEKYTEIFNILIEKGCLDGVRGGSVELHFDPTGIFQGPELHYWPWRRRKKLT